MTTSEIIVLAIALAMDAFAVAICQGLAMKEMKIKYNLIIALSFGLFQGIMPFIGYFVGISFSHKIAVIDHWIAFILLGVIGLNMIKDSYEDEQMEKDYKITLQTLILMSIATSIDALVVGVTFAFLGVDIIMSSSLIAFITALICFGGVFIGYLCGKKYKVLAERFGGITLIIIATKILVEHLFF